MTNLYDEMLCWPKPKFSRLAKPPVQPISETRTLQVCTRSTHAIRSITYDAAHNEARGWTCTNGDVMKIILQWIKRRSVPLHFIHLKKGVANRHLTAALELSATGCGLPCTDIPELDGPPIQPLVEPTLNIEKVCRRLYPTSQWIIIGLSRDQKVAYRKRTGSESTYDNQGYQNRYNIRKHMRFYLWEEEPRKLYFQVLCERCCRTSTNP
jgi:hypothetical protein